VPAGSLTQCGCDGAGIIHPVPDFVLDHTQQWIDHFRAEGHDAKPLAAGVEGAIYDLGGGLVAKVWRARGMNELERMQRFYGDVAAAGLPFATPEILEVHQVDDSAVTYERKLPGEPLQNRLRLDDRDLGPDAVRCVVEILRALAAVPATSGMRQLAVLDENESLWSGVPDFRAALSGLLGRRAARFGHVIRQHLPDFDERFNALQERLASISQRPDAVLHGDLFGENILVDADLRPLAVLDFGFLTTAGDPQLDAAITAGLMNMYGPHALGITQQLTTRLAHDLGYPAEALLIYQACYAVATSNAFTPDGSDGHFAWCIAQLGRADITAVLGL
jgi:aminoglycoside phosphotransferase (APT) family kinase protein